MPSILSLGFVQQLVYVSSCLKLYGLLGQRSGMIDWNITCFINRRIQHEGHMHPTSVTLKMDCRDKRADDMLVGNVSSRRYPSVATLSLKIELNRFLK